jgi:hypothetical protein
VDFPLGLTQKLKGADRALFYPGRQASPPNDFDQFADVPMGSMSVSRLPLLTVRVIMSGRMGMRE